MRLGGKLFTKFSTFLDTVLQRKKMTAGVSADGPASLRPDYAKPYFSRCSAQLSGMPLRSFAKVKPSGILVVVVREGGLAASEPGLVELVQGAGLAA